MEIRVDRFITSPIDTVGRLFINGVYKCYTLEDAERAVKIKGETCIPDGRYKVELITSGTHHESYKLKFPSMHHGMLHIMNVPNFQSILIHIGNFIKDTKGCLLVGIGLKYDGKVHSLIESTVAYELVYPIISKAILSKEEVYITYTTIYK